MIPFHRMLVGLIDNTDLIPFTCAVSPVFYVIVAALVVGLPLVGLVLHTIRRERLTARRLDEAQDERDKFFKLSLDLLCIAGTDGYFKRVNPAFERTLGYSEEELLGKSAFEFIHPEDREAARQELQKLIDGSDAIDFENRYICKDGSIRWLAWVCPALIPGQDRLYGVGRDITERKQAELKLKKARDELERRVDERTRELRATNETLTREITERKKTAEKLFAYQEELRLLASELAFSEERERRRIAEGLHDHIGQILASIKIKLGALREMTARHGIERPLDESRDLIEEGIRYTRSLTFELGSPVLYELGLESALESLIDKIREQHGIQSSFEDDGNPKPLQDDVRVVLYQAAQELLVNIAKHSHARNVKVASSRYNGEIRITVEDDGVGFNASELGTRLSTTGSFGLFNVRERLSHLGGRLEIESAPGQGTRATLAAPLKVSAPVKETEDERRQANH